MDGDTKEKISFLKKKEMVNILQHVDSNQLLEQYGGTLKIPQRLWPPADTYTPEHRNSIRPYVAPETASNKHTYLPGTNDAIMSIHSVIPFEGFSAEDFETKAIFNSEYLIPLEPKINKCSKFFVDIKDSSNLSNQERKDEPNSLVFNSERGMIDDQFNTPEMMSTPSTLSPFLIRPNSSEDSMGIEQKRNILIVHILILWT